MLTPCRDPKLCNDCRLSEAALAALVYWRIRKRAVVESVERMADVDISTEAMEKGWHRNYGKRANTSQPVL
jgi:hypothetical protein